MEAGGPARDQFLEREIIGLLVLSSFSLKHMKCMLGGEACNIEMCGPAALTFS
jgi:hypothetical protein